VGEWDFELRPVRPGVEPEDAPARVDAKAPRQGQRDVAGLLEEIIVRIDELASSVDRVNRRLAALEKPSGSEPDFDGDNFGDVASRRLRESRIARKLAGDGSRGPTAASPATQPAPSTAGPAS
jgi:hypothetical protein